MQIVLGSSWNKIEANKLLKISEKMTSLGRISFGTCLVIFSVLLSILFGYPQPKFTEEAMKELALATYSKSTGVYPGCDTVGELFSSRGSDYWSIS